MNAPSPLKAAAILLTSFACLAAWHQGSVDWFSLALLWPPLAAWGLLRGSRVVWGIMLVMSFAMATFAALIAWNGSGRGSPAWFLEHFRWTALYWLTLAALLSARASRAAMGARV